MSTATPGAPPVPEGETEASQPPSRTLAGTPDVRTASAALDAALFTGGTYLAHGIQFITGLLQKAILGPAGAGAWALMQSFWTFMSISSLGAQPGATRQVPMHRGRGDLAAAEEAADTAGTFSLAAMGLVGVVMAAVAILFGAGWKEEVRFGVVLLGLTAPLRLFTDIHEVLIQAVKRFDVASATLVVKALVGLVVTTLSVLAFGFYGMFLAVVLVELSALAFLWRTGVIGHGRRAFSFRIQRARLRELISFGAPILVYAQVWLLFQAVDQLIVATALDLRQLGFYALAVSVTSYVLFLPKSIGGAVFPRMAERFGRTGSLDDIHHYATDVQRLLAYVLVPVAVGGGFFAFPVLIRHFLPAFTPAVAVVQVMVAASFFMALMNMPTKVLMTAGYRWSLTGIAAACLVLNAGLNILFVVGLDEGLRGAATATAISYLTTFLITTTFALSRALPLRRVAGHVLEILAVFAYVYGVLRGLEWLLGSAPDQFLGDAGLAAAKLVLFLVALTPCFVLAQKRVAAFSLLREPAEKVLRRLRRG